MVVEDDNFDDIVSTYARRLCRLKARQQCWKYNETELVNLKCFFRVSASTCLVASRRQMQLKKVFLRCFMLQLEGYNTSWCWDTMVSSWHMSKKKFIRHKRLLACFRRWNVCKKKFFVACMLQMNIRQKLAETLKKIYFHPCGFMSLATTSSSVHKSTFCRSTFSVGAMSTFLHTRIN